MNLLTQARTELLKSNTDKNHPFRYCTFSTIHEYPETRMVVTRKIGPQLNVTFFTDSRTPKVKHIQTNNKVAALFYHPTKRLQIRIKGTASMIDKEHAEYPSYLQQMKQSPSLRDYTTLAPPGSPLPIEPDVFGTALHFMPIILESIYLDILLLRRAGHLRSEYFLESGEWVERRLVP